MCFVPEYWSGIVWTGDFGTVIVHDRVETGKTATVPASTRAEESSPAAGFAAKPPVSGAVDKAKDSRYSFISDSSFYF